ncbi:MAG TPA: DUF5615 family PIN-like protein [Thermoanaerobaculia bacterium]
MAGEIRFHFDECVPFPAAEGLRRRGIDATTSPETGLLHAKDESQLAHATREGRVLVTQDADFLRIHGQGVRHRGIAYYEPGVLTIGQLVKALVLVHAVLTPEEMENQVEFL